MSEALHQSKSRRLVRWLLFITCMICIAANARKVDEIIPLSAHSLSEGQRITLDYYKEHESSLNLEQALKLPSDKWTRLPWTLNSFGFSNTPYWFRSTKLSVEHGVEEVLFEIAYPLLDSVEMYIRTNPKAPWRSWRMGDRQPFTDRYFLTRNFVVPVAVRSGDVLEIMVKVSTSGAMRFPLFVSDREKIESMEHRFLLINGIYIGLMGGLFLYHLIIYLIVREHIYLYYAGWIFSTASFSLSYNGIASQYLWPDATNWSDWCRVVFMLLGSGMFTSFTLEFLKPKNSRKLCLLHSAWPVVATIVIGIGAAFLPFSIAARLCLIIQIVSVVLCFGLAFANARAGHLLAKIFLLAFSGVMLGTVALALDLWSITRYVKGLSSLELGPQIGSALAVILFSLALANRLLEARRHRFLAAEMKRINQALEASMLAEQDRSKTLLELRMEAERRDRDKSRFLADAVHDLRQPLQAVGNALDPIANAIRTGHTVNALNLVGMANRATEKMRSQLSEILNLSRLESGFVEAQLSDFDIASLISEAVFQARAGVTTNATSIDFSCPLGKPVFVRSDKHLVQRILLNLISNGVKYRSSATGESCRVQIILEEHEGLVCIAVKDNGIGISEDILRNDLIFKPFFQVNNRHAEAEKGVGLGLSIVAAMLCLLKDHRLEIISAVGVGSTFTLKIPASPLLPIFESIPLKDFATGGVQAASGKYVILVEDDVLIRDTLAAVFGIHGIQYEACGSIEEMQTVLEGIERAPDVLLSDYRLPDDKTACDAMRLMREHWDDVPTIILTGETFNPTSNAQLQGVSICYKPIAPLDLLRQIGASAERRTPPANFGLL